MTRSGVLCWRYTEWPILTRECGRVLGSEMGSKENCSARLDWTWVCCRVFLNCKISISASGPSSCLSLPLRAVNVCVGLRLVCGEISSFREAKRTFGSMSGGAGAAAELDMTSWLPMCRRPFTQLFGHRAVLPGRALEQKGLIVST